MPETNVPPEFEQQLRQALDVPEPDGASLDGLRERFISLGVTQLRALNGAAGRPARTSPPRRGFFSLPLAVKAATLVLAMLALLAFFSPQVVNAIRGLFGYLPSVGVVDQDADVLVLEEPVQAVQGGISLTVERAFATREKTVVVYQYRPPAWDGKAYQQPEAPDQPVLLLPDGSRLEVVVGRRQPADDRAIRYALEFGPLPAGVAAATLHLDRLAGMPSALSPKDWSIPLRFEPGDPAKILFPVTVYEPTETAIGAPAAAVPTDNQSAPPTVEPTQAAVATAALASPAYGAAILLEQSVELPDGYLLMGSFRWTDPSAGPNNLALGMPVIGDANGQAIEYAIAPVDSYPQPGELRQNWAIKLPGKTFAAPLRLEFYVTLREPASVPFQFDPGPDPQNGQTYDLDVDLPVNAHQVKIVSVRHQVLESVGHAFLFTLTADPYVIGAWIIDPAHPPMGGGGGGYGIPPTNVPFTSGVVVEGELPPGPLNLQIVNLDVLVPGDWVITWSPEK
jgi:hypothetical protein